MARGYQRRHADAWRRTRMVGAILLNVNRSEGSAAIIPEEWLPLYGDTPPEPVQVMSEEEWARIAALD